MAFMSVLVLLPARVVDPVGVDAFLADLFGDGFVVGDRVLVEADPLNRNGLLLDHGTFLVERNLVFFFADGRTVEGRVAVGVGYGLALDPDFFTLYRDGLGDVLRRDILAQPRPAGCLPFGTDVQTLLGAGHRIIGRGSGGIPPHGVAGVIVSISPGVSIVSVAARDSGICIAPVAAGGAGLGVSVGALAAAEAVVLVEPVFLGGV